MSDEFSMHFERQDLQNAVKGTRREQLEALRDYIARQLEGELCKTCLMSRLRTGDQASLILRLQQILGEIETLPSGDEEVSDLERFRLRAVGGSGPSRPPDTEDRPLSGKSAQRRSSGRRPRSDGGTAS